MGQEDEEAAELIATIRGEHVAMKTWYSGSSSAAEALRTRYGPYPSLWKEVLNWPGWKEARKAYLQFTQIGETQSSAPSDSGGVRKRRSRWGTASDAAQDNGGGDASESSNKRRSRWGKEESDPPGVPASHMMGNPVQPQQQPHWQQQQQQQQQLQHQSPPQPLPGLVLPGMPSHLSPQQQAELQRLQGRLREINEKMSNLDAEAARVDALPRGHRERSPSPPPVYDAEGKRKNTRAVRWRERYNDERQDILERLMSLNPATRQSSLFKRKRTKKIRIPIEEHPNYNFIGLIIGPRGKTQKELESKTGCKIAIRGKGSVKEGARGRRDGKMMDGDDEPLHVVITGDDQKSVDAAADMIEQMLVVIDDEKNVHKQQQLRELALLNGTLKEDEYCQICAEKGHRSFECPRRFALSKQPLAVKCAICGDTSHPTRDCTQKPTVDKTNEQELDSDYMSFMAELDGKKSAATPAAVPVSGVTILKPAVPVNASASETPAPSTGITILKPATKICVPVNSDSAPDFGDTAPHNEPTGAASSSLQLPPVPPPMANLPPGLPPPPVGLPPPPLPAATLPPPPGMPAVSSYAPPPSQPGNYYGNNNDYGGNYHPQNNATQGYGQWNQQPQQQQQQQQQQQYQSNQAYQYNANGQQPQQPQQMQQQQGQQQPRQQPQGGDATTGWDYQAYYGNGGASGGTGGAGGFNWWEQ